MEERIAIGLLQKPFGLKGEIRGKSLTSFPSLRFKKGRQYSLYNPKTSDLVSVTLLSFRPSDDYFFIRFEEIDTVEKAGEYRGYEIQMPLKEASLPDGYFRLADLIGMRVIDNETGETLGTIIDVLDYSKISTIKAIKENGKSFTFPFLYEKFVVNVDVTKKEMRIHVMEGLL